MIALALLLVVSDSLGREYKGEVGDVQVAPPRIEATITVDGVLDEQIWLQAARLTEFSQYSPTDGRPAQHETEIFVWYSATAIHFGIRAHAPPGTVRATLADRDKLEDEDRVQIYLATYNDGRQAMVFGVNPLGVQSDGVLVEGSSSGRGGGFFGGGGGGGRVDDSPDFRFESKGQVTDFGYEVEIQIPFKSLRYQPAERQTWGLHVVRRVQQTGHEESWVPARRSAQSFLAQAGSLVELTDLRRGLVMDLNPSITGRANGEPIGEGWDYQEVMEVGANVRWGLTPNLTLNATANPDFSQIEADASQVIDDPRRALFFEEKRPFFLDGIEAFNTPNSLIYTRRIAAPSAATKLTGKVGETDLAALFALDGKATSLTEDRHPVVAAVRVQRDLGSQSKLGLVYTDRTDRDYFNRVGGIDTRVILGDWALTGQLAGSVTREEGATTTAPLWQAGVQRSGQQFGLSYSFSGISDDFQAATGFISRGGVVNTRLHHSLTFYGARDALVERTYLSAFVSGTWVYDDFVHGRGIQDRSLWMTGSLTLRGGWRFQGNVTVESSGFDEGLYEDYAIERRVGATVDTIPFIGVPRIANARGRLEINSPRLGSVAFRTEISYGSDVNFLEWSPGRIFNVTNSVQYFPTSQLRFDAGYRMQSYRRKSDGTIASITHIPRLKVEYQISRAIFFRLVGEYRSVAKDSVRDDSRTDLPVLIRDEEDGIFKRSLAVAQVDNDIRSEFLFSFQPTPGTVLFLGYTGSYTEDERFRFSGLNRTIDGFFLKASYLFRM
jgi:hypothetical protein